MRRVVALGAGHGKATTTLTACVVAYWRLPVLGLLAPLHGFMGLLALADTPRPGTRGVFARPASLGIGPSPNPSGLPTFARECCRKTSSRSSMI